MENINQNPDETKIKMLYAFIRECDEMLRNAKGLPNKEASILKRLNDSQRSLDILLAKKLHDTVREEGAKTRKEIIHHIKKPIIDKKYKFNFPSIMIVLRKGDFWINNEDEKIFSGKGILEIEGGICDSKKIKIAAIPFLLLYVLAKGSQQDSVPIEYRFYGDIDIENAVPIWENCRERYIGGVVKRLKNKYLGDYKDLIENTYSKGYRISTHPQNIEIDDELETLLQKEIRL